MPPLTLSNPNPKKILIRATNWIGDGVMMTPSLGVIRQIFPDAEIVIAANPLVAELFKNHPWCDRVMVFESRGLHRGLAGLWRFSKEIQAEKFDLAILLQKAFKAALIAFLAKIPERIGYDTDVRGFLLTKRARLTPEIKLMHHSRHYLEMLKAFGIGADIGELKLELTRHEIERGAELLGKGEWLVLNPGAAYGAAKRWYPERFAEVGDRLANEKGMHVVIIGGPGEKEIGRDIENIMSCNPVNLVGETTVREMMAIIANSKLMVTNDSGPMHVAAALQIPIVAIFGPTDHKTTFPWCDAYQIVRSDVDCAPCCKRKCPIDHRCMLDVTSDDVVDAVSHLFNQLSAETAGDKSHLNELRK